MTNGEKVRELKSALKNMFHLKEAKEQLAKNFPVGTAGCEDGYKTFEEYEDKIWEIAEKALKI